MTSFIYAISGFLILLFVLVYLRIKSNNKLNIQNSDILLALFPVVLWLFLTGRIQEFTFGDFKIVAAVNEASRSPVESQVTHLPVESVKIGQKGGVDNIPNLLQDKVQALSFRLGHGGYWGPAISDYLRVLTANSDLQYIILNEADGTFFGMADAQRLA